MDKVEKLKNIIEINYIYSAYLYDEFDEGPINELLEKYDMKPIGEMRVKFKDNLKEGYEEFQGTTHFVYCINNCPTYNICIKDVEGEFDVSQIKEII